MILGPAIVRKLLVALWRVQQGDVIVPDILQFGALGPVLFLHPVVDLGGCLLGHIQSYMQLVGLSVGQHEQDQCLIILVLTKNGDILLCASLLPVEVVVAELVTILPPMLPLSSPLTLQPIPPVAPPVLLLTPELPQRTFVSPLLSLLR